MNEHGQIIKEGVIFGYLCQGLGGMARNHLVYRFGKSTKTVLPDHVHETDRTKIAIERLGTAFGGLNRPEVVVMWEDVRDVHRAWEITRDYLRNTLYVPTSTRRPRDPAGVPARGQLLLAQVHVHVHQLHRALKRSVRDPVQNRSLMYYRCPRCRLLQKRLMCYRHRAEGPVFCFPVVVKPLCCPGC